MRSVGSKTRWPDCGPTFVSLPRDPAGIRIRGLDDEPFVLKPVCCNVFHGLHNSIIVLGTTDVLQHSAVGGLREAWLGPQCQHCGLTPDRAAQLCGDNCVGTAKYSTSSIMKQFVRVFRTIGGNRTVRRRRKCYFLQDIGYCCQSATNTEKTIQQKKQYGYYIYEQYGELWRKL